MSKGERFLTKHPFPVWAQMFTFLGGIVMLVMAISFIVNNRRDMALPLALLSLWIVIGLVFYVLARRISAKLERMRGVGMAHNARILRLIPRRIVRIGHYTTVVAECEFMWRGEQRVVRSGMFLWKSLDSRGLHAVVYADDNGDYAVEIAGQISDQE